MIFEYLSKFILHTKEGGLKTAEYPKEYLDLRRKVFFGKRALAVEGKCKIANEK